MERKIPNQFDKQEILADLYERLFNLYDLEEKGWQVNQAIEKVREEIEQLRQNRLDELRQELGEIQKSYEGEGMPSTNSRA